MNQRILVAVATALVFGAGVLAGISYEYHRPLPAPPGQMMDEFTGRNHGPPRGRQAQPQMSRADLFAQVEKVRPDIEAFQKRVDEIEDNFEKALDPLLTPDQRAANEKRLKQHAEFRSTNESQPLSDEQLLRIMNWPSFMLLRVVSLQVGYDVLNTALKLDDSQRDKVQGLLRARRDQYLALMDTLPPPSLALMHLAPYAQRLGRPQGHPPGPPSKP